MRHLKKVICSWSFVISMLILADQLQGAILNCISCVDCPEDASGVTTTVQCGTVTINDNCAIFKNADGLVQRGCRSSNQLRTLLDQCAVNRCNTGRAPVCEECTSLNECKSVACDKLNDNCYVKKTDDSRGCTSDGIYQDPADFEKCSTDRCNRVARCVVCNSDNPEQGNCLKEPAKFVVPCANHGVIREKNCYRFEESQDKFQLGCTSAEDVPICDESSNCKTCEADECNSKAFPACYICNDCATLTEQEPTICTDYDDVCFTAYDSTKKITDRGCLDGLTEEAVGDIVTTCLESNCNDAEFPASTHRKCYQENIGEVEYCRSTDATKCFTLKDEGGNTLRGCDTDAEFADCSEFKNCVVCDSNECNADEQPAECVVCEGSEQCRDNPSQQKCDEASFHVGCFTHLTSDTIQKGCLNELKNVDPESSTFLACDKDEPSCHKCIGSYCNTVHCLQCDSQSDNEACVEGNPAAISYGVCPPEDQCLMFVDGDGYTKRGCSSNFKDTQEVGFGPGHNIGLFPKEAIKCYQCAENCKEPNDEQLKYCSQNNELGCYYKFDAISGMSRGCLSEEGLNCAEDPNCFDCKEEDGCNSKSLFECYDCTFDNADEDCVNSVNPQTCATTGKCVVYKNEEGKFVRGCVNDESQPLQSCAKTCESDKCNDNDVCAATNECEGICSDAQTGDKCVRYQNNGVENLGCIEFKNTVCAANDEHCYTCGKNLCNTADVAECFSCTDCPTIAQHTTKLCADINDECYTTKDGNGQVIRGCLAEINDGLTADQTCQGPACNKNPLLDGHSCYQCKNCDIIDALTPEPCNVQTIQRCYTAQDTTDLSITRGCVTDTDYAENCRADFNCLNCEGAACNTDKVRSEPLWCSSCSERECFDYTPAEPCREGMLVDRCVKYTVIVTPNFMGCLSSTSMPTNIKDDCYSGGSFCQLCDDNYCNTPDLSCYECSSASEDGFDCIANPKALGKTSKCGGLAHCYTRVAEDDGHLSRGCSTENIAECTGPLCKSCQDHECNLDVVPEDRLHCYQCEGVDCLKPTNSKPCLTYAEGQQCYTYVEDETTISRGCSNDESALMCNDKPCVKCSEKDCNNQPAIVENTLSCIQCTSNSDCDGRAFGQTCSKGHLLGRSDLCYTQYTTGIPVEKGCLSDLSPQNPGYSDCMENNERCGTCGTDDCNRGTALCYVCDSELDDDCAQITNTTNHISECEGKCVTLVEDYTKRGCIESFPDLNEADCESSSQCEICQGKQCNDKMLPSERTQCYVCQGSECANPSQALVKACSRFDENDRCYTHVVNETWVQRDCLSSLGTESCDGYCQPCTGKGCNSQAVTQPSSLTCVKCEGDACNGQVTGSKCTASVLFGRQDSCYTYQDGAVVSRGCLSDLKEDDHIREQCTGEDGKLCVLCSADNCNGDSHYCVSCNSQQDGGCGGQMTDVPQSMMELCSEHKCVSFIDADGHTHKGCRSETNNCDQASGQCVECTEPMCNNVLFPAERIQCHRCAQGENCNDKPTSTPAVCSKYDPEDACYVRVDGEALTRGCQSDAPVVCESCFHETCAADGCNDHPYTFESSLSCIQCEGTRACGSANESVSCTGMVTLGQPDQCFSLVANTEVIRKGCSRSLPGGCTEPECTTCDCNGCNLISANSKDISCFNCEGEGCGNALTVGDGTCNDKACVSYVSKEGVVSRGCLSAFVTKCSDYGTKHETCLDANCNRNVFPKDRILCHRCEDCSADIGSPTTCPAYVEDDECYTAISVDGAKISRGCQSELPGTCVGPLCVVCGESGCNNGNPFEPGTTGTPEITTTPDPNEITTTPNTNEITTTPNTDAGTTTPNTNEITTTPHTDEGTTTTTTATTTTEPPGLACIRCEQSTSDASCAWGFKPTAASQCPSEQETGCFTCQRDRLTVRGCSSERTASSCTSEPETCTGNACNNANLRTQRCAVCSNSILCDSTYTVNDCAGIVEYADRGCYLLRNERRAVVERGCYATLSEDFRRICQTSREACSVCLEDGCNSGVMVRVFNGLLATVVVLGFMRNLVF